MRKFLITDCMAARAQAFTYRWPQKAGTRHLERKHNVIQRHPLQQESPVLGAMGLQMCTDVRLCTQCISSHLCVQGTARYQSTRFPPIVQRASAPQPTWDLNPRNPASLAAAHTQPHFSMSTTMPQVCDCQCRDMVVQHTSKNHAASAQEDSLATCQQAVGIVMGRLPVAHDQDLANGTTTAAS